MSEIWPALHDISAFLEVIVLCFRMARCTKVFLCLERDLLVSFRLVASPVKHGMSEFSEG